MQLNQVFYQILAPSAVVGPSGAENWSMVGMGPSFEELDAAARQTGLRSYVIAVVVCLKKQEPALANGLIVGAN